VVVGGVELVADLRRKASYFADAAPADAGGHGTQMEDPPEVLPDLAPADGLPLRGVDWGPITVTRRSLDLGIRIGTLLFTLIYGTNLYLLTTAPEEITLALER
jgi:hypothetical protein